MSLVTDHNGHCIMWHNLIDHRGSRELGNTFRFMIIMVAAAGVVVANTCLLCHVCQQRCGVMAGTWDDPVTIIHHSRDCFSHNTRLCDASSYRRIALYTLPSPSNKPLSDSSHGRNTQSPTRLQTSSGERVAAKADHARINSSK